MAPCPNFRLYLPSAGGSRHHCKAFAFLGGQMVRRTRVHVLGTEGLLLLRRLETRYRNDHPISRRCNISLTSKRRQTRFDFVNRRWLRRLASWGIFFVYVQSYTVLVRTMSHCEPELFEGALRLRRCPRWVVCAGRTLLVNQPIAMFVRVCLAASMFRNLAPKPSHNSRAVVALEQAYVAEALAPAMLSGMRQTCQAESMYVLNIIVRYFRDTFETYRLDTFDILGGNLPWGFCAWRDNS